MSTDVFKPSKLVTNYKIIPIITTYLVSSFLHGFNFQIASVLLTLGFLTYFEYETRNKLSSIYNICCLSKSCPKSSLTTINSASSAGNASKTCCLNNHKDGHKLIKMTINAVFRVLSILNLAYLGSTFDGKEDSANYQNVINVWTELGFYSHIFLFINLIVYLIIGSVWMETMSKSLISLVILISIFP